MPKLVGKVHVGPIDNSTLLLIKLALTGLGSTNMRFGDSRCIRVGDDVCKHVTHCSIAFWTVGIAECCGFECINMAIHALQPVGHRAKYRLGMAAKFTSSTR